MNIVEAAKRGHLEEVIQFLKRGVDVNHTDSDGWTPLLAAARYGQLEIVKFLFEKGADINLPEPDQTSPLMLASDFNYFGVVKFLLENGVDISAEDDCGETALFDSIYSGNHGVTLLFCKHRHLLKAYDRRLLKNQRYRCKLKKAL